jgi:hypothetical protein
VLTITGQQIPPHIVPRGHEITVSDISRHNASDVPRWTIPPIPRGPRKSRVPCTPQHPTAVTSALGDEPLAQPDLEQRLEDLRKAYHADKPSRDLIVGTQIRSVEGEISLLMGQISQDTAAIAAWEERYNGLQIPSSMYQNGGNAEDRLVNELQPFTQAQLEFVENIAKHEGYRARSICQY